MQHDTTAALTAQDLFGLAVTEAASKALSRYPDDVKRITDAVRMIGEGLVTLKPGGARVESDTTFGLYYDVNGACECLDYVRGKTERCKHKYGYWLLRCALALLQEQAEADAWQRKYPVVQTAPRREAAPCTMRRCETHGWLLTRRIALSAPYHGEAVYGHLDRAKRFSVCPG